MLENGTQTLDARCGDGENYQVRDSHLFGDLERSDLEVVTIWERLPTLSRTLHDFFMVVR